MFIEINQISRYCNNNEQDDKGNWKYKAVVIGKILINTDEIRCISVDGFEWEDREKYIVKENSQRYCVYFDKDRYINTDLQSYNKIMKYVLTEESYEKI